MKKQISLKNGESYSYLETGTGPKTLVLIHGNLSSSVYYTPLMERLPADLRVLAPDLRGFGDSSYVHRTGSLLELAGDIKLFLDALGVKQASILGWSLGGGVAMEFAAAYPEMTEKLILIDATTHRGYPIFKKNAAFQQEIGAAYASADEMANDPLQVKPVIDALNAKNAAFMSYIYDLTIYTKNKPTHEQNALWIGETLKQRCLADVDFALACLNMGAEPNFYRAGTNAIAKIHCPVLHFWGALDRVVLEAMVLDNIRGIPGPSTYVKLDDCGHSPLVDKPAELADHITRFLL
ncbi:MAG TPA: alpha/beta hydrolase [Acholeplasmatales bacterium]|nr:alpha/beta hydrolase [Acholeplasmatales bacterium]